MRSNTTFTHTLKIKVYLLLLVIGIACNPATGQETSITSIQQMAEQGNTKEAWNAASDLLKESTKTGDTQTREAALQLLMNIKPEESTKLLLSALKDKDQSYRNAALTFASSFTNQELYIDVMKYMLKAKPDTQVDILNWIGRECESSSKRETLKNLELRFDLPARQALINLLQKNKEFKVREATAWTLTRIGDKTVIPNLADLLKKESQQEILLGKETLAAFPGDIDQAVARVIPSAPDAGKIAGLELLALRKADANLNAVLEQVRSTSPEVKATAYKALKDVVSANDFTRMCGMLETADPSAIEPLQEAVIATLAKQPSDTRIPNVSRRMIQAGNNKKHLYYKVLSATGEKEAWEILTDGFEHDTGEAKEAARKALLDWNIEKATEEEKTYLKRIKEDQP